MQCFVKGKWSKKQLKSALDGDLSFLPRKRMARTTILELATSAVTVQRCKVYSDLEDTRGLPNYA